MTRRNVLKRNGFPKKNFYRKADRLAGALNEIEAWDSLISFYSRQIGRICIE
jgi:hypothetical protein